MGVHEGEWNIWCHIHFPNKIERNFFTTFAFFSSSICYFHCWLFRFGKQWIVSASVLYVLYLYIFYDRKMTFRCVCVWFEMMTIATTATATTTASMMEKLFQINGKCCPNDRCCCWFYCPYYFYRQHYHRALFLRIANRFMSFQFFFALSFFSIFSYHRFFCSTSCQTVNVPVYFFPLLLPFWSVPFSFSMWKTLELRAYASS